MSVLAQLFEALVRFHQYLPTVMQCAHTRATADLGGEIAFIFHIYFTLLVEAYFFIVGPALVQGLIQQ